MATSRVEIVGDTVTMAMRMASEGVNGIQDFADTRVPGFVLRVRGNAITWLFKTRDQTRKLGAPPKVGVRDARRQAEAARAEYTSRKPVEQAMSEPAAEGWTWNELAQRYITHISGTRIKRGEERPPSPHTIVDAKRAFDRPALATWRERQISSLGAVDLVDAIKKTVTDVSYRQADKMHAYIRSALTWALSNSAREAGLSNAWWQPVRMPEPTGDEVKKIVARKRPTAVSGFGRQGDRPSPCAP